MRAYTQIIGKDDQGEGWIREGEEAVQWQPDDENATVNHTLIFRCVSRNIYFYFQNRYISCIGKHVEQSCVECVYTLQSDEHLKKPHHTNCWPALKRRYADWVVKLQAEISQLNASIRTSSRQSWHYPYLNEFKQIFTIAGDLMADIQVPPHFSNYADNDI